MYVIIEGIDGCGKDTQGDRLAGRLAGTNKCLRVNEPDDSLPTGKLLRQMLKDGTYVEAHAAMFLADRMAMLATKVRPRLAQGHDVVGVRSWMSTLVYQQDNWPLAWLLDIHRQLPCKATHLIVLDLDPEVALQRVTKRPGHMEFYEKLDTQKRNRQRYLDLVPVAPTFLAEGGRVGVIDASGTPDEVEASITAWLEQVQ
jgi:dTMP kinase